ncbi:Uncharacterized protein FKW44_013706, partial [Caligus rogercresseyi]
IYSGIRSKALTSTAYQIDQRYDRCDRRSQSPEFNAFIKSCQIAFTLLRRNSDLIVELFASSS